MRRAITQILLFNGVSQVPLHRTRITLHDFLLKSTAKIRQFCELAKFIFRRGCERSNIQQKFTLINENNLR